jgi:hypothetical protein
MQWAISFKPFFRPTIMVVALIALSALDKNVTLFEKNAIVRRCLLSTSEDVDSYGKS